MERRREERRRVEEMPSEEEVPERLGGVRETPESRRWVLVGSEESRIKRLARSERQRERKRLKGRRPPAEQVILTFHLHIWMLRSTSGPLTKPLP